MHGRLTTLNISLKRDAQTWSQFIHTVPWDSIQELLRGLSTYWIDYIGRNLCQGGQHKGTLCHTRMRHGQFFLRNMKIIVKDNIDIYWARAIAKSWLSA